MLVLILYYFKLRYFICLYKRLYSLKYILDIKNKNIIVAYNYIIINITSIYILIKFL